MTDRDPPSTPDRRLQRIAGQDIYLDWEGFLWDPRDWNEDIARELAREGGLSELNDSQWRVIRFLREFYLVQGRAPKNREIKAGTGLGLTEVERWFPQGIKLGARRIAGLPNPKSCL